MSTVLKRYSLLFSVKDEMKAKTGQCDTTNPAYTTLANFVYEINWSSEAERIIMSLNAVLRNQILSEEFQTHYLLAEATHANTVFVDIDNPQGFNNPDLIIPTIDFRDIMVEWKNFLKQMGI
jgi:hypothetical protein